MTQIQEINEKIKRELADEATVRALLATTFKGLDVVKMKQALIEGMVRGFEFKDFLQKDVYAIPFSNGYSLVTSIDFSRKIGMRSGIVGKEAPTYEMDGEKIVSCSVTVKRKVNEYVGDFTATVFFSEYSTGKNLWASKPRTMIAKVAEMHALRMACPEELAKAYIEEEMNGGSIMDVIDNESQAEISALDTVEAVNEYYKANKGKGKAFDKAIIARKRELETSDKEEVK